MRASRRELRSAYMEWSKIHSHARYELSSSGVESYPLARLPVRLEDLEITGPAAYGYSPLQERLATKAGVSPVNVVAAVGTSMANYLAMASVLDPGDEVLVEHPTYELILSTAEYLGADVRRFPRRAADGFRVDAGDVKREITSSTRLVVLTNLHNPTGARTDDATLREIGEIAAANGARVMVDEVYLEACFEAPAPLSAFHLGANFLATSSLTKAYGLSGLRCGWILAEPTLAERMWRHFDFIGASSAHTAERMSVVALDHLGEIAAHARGLLDRNRALLHRFLDSRDDLETFRPEGGTVCFPRLKSGRVEELCRILREKYDTSVVPGRFFEMPDHFRIGIGGETAMVEEGLARLGRALDEPR